MLRRRVNYYSICIGLGLSVILILAGNRYIISTNCSENTPELEARRASESQCSKTNFSKAGLVDDNILPIPTNTSKSYHEIEKILKETRIKISYEMLSYNFTISGVQSLDDLLMESGGKPVRSLIISTWRSGTTFLGEVLNSVPWNFYHYEPFLCNGIIQIRGTPESDKALKTIKNMFQCKFDNMQDYFNFGKNNWYQFSHNTRLWDHCKYKKELCLDPDFTARFCRLFPFQSMKVVRVRLRLIKQLLDDKELNLSVILLIRDPRAVILSRQYRDFCKPAPDCGEPELLCADMISDYFEARRLILQYPDRFIALRYEELALNPNTTLHDLLKFFRLNVTQSVEEYIQSHTNVEVEGTSSTFRVSREVPFRWKNVLNFSHVDEIQATCKEAMTLWGYRLAYNATHMASKDFNPMNEYSLLPNEFKI